MCLLSTMPKKVLIEFERRSSAKILEFQSVPLTLLPWMSGIYPFTLAIDLGKWRSPLFPEVVSDSDHHRSTPQ